MSASQPGTVGPNRVCRLALTSGFGYALAYGQCLKKENSHSKRTQIGGKVKSQTVVAESHQLAEAATELLVRDAEARRELIADQQELTNQLNEKQSAVYSGHEPLEQDQREIAQQRHRDPNVGAAIQNFGLVIDFWRLCRRVISLLDWLMAISGALATSV